VANSDRPAARYHVAAAVIDRLADHVETHLDIALLDRIV